MSEGPNEPDAPPRSVDDIVAGLSRHVAELILVVDAGGIIWWANDAMTRILGQRPAEWVGRHGSELAHPDDVPLGLELMVSAMATGPGVKEPVTYRLAHTDGRWVALECIATTVALAGGDSVFVLSFRPSGVARPIGAIFDEASQRVSLMFEEASIGMAQIGLDGRVLRANAMLAEILHTTADRLAGSDFLAYVHPDDHDRVVSRRREMEVDPGARSTQIRLVVPTDEDEPGPTDPDRGADDGLVHVRLTTSLVLDRDASPLYYAVQVSDVTDLVGARRSQAESEQRFRTILELAQEGIIAVDGEQVVRFANQRMAEMLGRTVADVVGRPIEQLVRAHVVDSELPDPERRPGEALRFEARFRAAGGEVRWVLVATRPESWPIDGSLGTVVMVTDIDRLKAAEAELRHRSTHDPLTGLANRALLEVAWDAAAGESAADAVILLDLDGFKAVNDTSGHADGDAVLVEVARRLTASVRRGDLVARFGGDEFVVVCRGADRATAVHLAERLVDDLNRPFLVGEHVFDLGASAGLAMGRPGVSHLDLLREADEALYDAKGRGGRQVRAAGADG